MIEVRLGVGTPGFMRRGELRLQCFVLADQRGAWSLGSTSRSCGDKVTVNSERLALSAGTNTPQP